MASNLLKTAIGFEYAECRGALAILAPRCKLRRLRRHPVGSFLFALAVSAFILQSARAVSFTWIRPSDGIWDTATNWTPFQPLPPNPIVGPPDTGDVAIIQSPYRVTLLDDYPALAGLLIANGASVNTNFNELSVVVPDVGAVVTITGEGSKLIVRNESGNANAFFFDQLNLSNGGELDIEGAVARIFATGGAGEGGLDVDADSRITGRGELNVPSHITGSDFNNRGTIRPDVNQTIAITAPFGTPSIDLDGSGPNLNSHLDLSNAGATLIVEPVLTDAYGGLITLGDDSTLTINQSWTLAGTFDLPSRIVFDPGADNFAHVSGGLLRIGGESFHGNLQALSGVGNFSGPVELHSNANVSVAEDATISFNGAATVHGGTFTLGLRSNIDFFGPTTVTGGTFNTWSPFTFLDTDVDFFGPTIYNGNLTINGMAQQYGDSTVNGATIISGNTFDMDGSFSEDTVWSINASLEVNVDRIDISNNRFDGTIEISGPLAARLTNLSDPQAAWQMDGTMNVTGTSFGFTNRLAGSRMVVTGDLNVQQRADISADTTLGSGSTTDIDASSHILQMSGATVVESGAAITGNGYLQNAPSGNMLLPVGLSTGNVGLSNQGTLRLGEAVGVISVAEFVQGDAATLVVDVGKNKAGTNSDVLTTGSGAAAVDGFIQPNITAIGGTFVAPQIGDSFTILTAVGGVSGTFDDVLHSNLGGMIYEWNLIHNPDNVVIQVAGIDGLLGDFNGDGFVNMADYVVWRNTLGSTTILVADGSMNGTIDQDDYDVWVANFGAILGSGSGDAVVPEPKSILLVGLAIAGIYSRCRVLYQSSDRST